MSDDLLKELIQENDYIEYLHEFAKNLKVKVIGVL